MKTEPLSHQLKDFELTKDLVAWGVWWEQGTGKSKLLIDTCCHLFTQGRIQAVVVVAPNGVHGNMVYQEFPKHAWVEWDGYVYDTGRAGTKRDEQRRNCLLHEPSMKLRVVAISYDALRTKKGFDFVRDMLVKYRCLCALDESTAIANHTTERAKAAHKLGPLACYRRTMSGTPAAEGPFKVYSQIKWLDSTYWSRNGLSSLTVFRNTFGVFKTSHARGSTDEEGRYVKGHQYQELVEYRNLEYLQELVSGIGSRVLKEDVLDLPPKVYTRVEFEMAPKQARVYAELKEQFRTEIEAGQVVEAQTALVRLTRLQQITSGYVGVDETTPPAVGDLVILQRDGYVVHGEIKELTLAGTGFVDGHRVLPGQTTAPNPEGLEWREPFQLPDERMHRLVAAKQKIVDIFDKPGDNPRLMALLAVLEPLTHKVIIWARFTRDIDLICSELGEHAVRYDGQVGTRERERALSSFREDANVRYFVANPATLSMGVTLTQAKTVVYYSNNFQLEKRLQSEDRAHRIGQDQKVNIVDLAAHGTVDEYIIETLREKFDLAATVTGDRLRDWIR